MSEYVNKGNTVVCPTCNKKYRVKFKKVHYAGAGSAADMLHIHLPCKHTSTDEYDDNHWHVEKITEILPDEESS